MLAAAEFMPVIEFEPDVSVGPFTVILYPDPALVEAAIWEVVMDVSVGENRRSKLMAPVVAVEQSGTLLVVLTVPPVQKTRDSGMVPVRVICCAVLAVTTPLSPTVEVASVVA
jgi:hypothetical protein